MRATTLCLASTLGLLLFACQDNTSQHTGSATIAMPTLAKTNGCNNCHAIDARVVGPTWMEVSRRYKGVSKYTYRGQEYPLEEGLALKVSMGGSGNWGAMPMPGNDPKGVKQAEIRELVKFVLELNR